MLKAIPIRNSRTGDGGHVQCPNCKAFLFVTWKNCEAHTDTVVCDCGMPLEVPVLRTWTFVRCIECKKLVDDCKCGAWQ